MGKILGYFALEKHLFINMHNPQFGKTTLFMAIKGMPKY